MARITKANAKGERVLTLRELNRALLERQLLLARQRLTVPRAIERLCALQAQYAPSPYIALWSRLTGFRKEQLTRALEDRKAVKSSLFRITLHITSARDYPYYAAAWLPAAREMTPRVTVERMAELSRKVHAAAQKQITHEQLEAIAAEEMGGRWRTRTLAPLLHVPPAGTWGFHGRPELLVLDAWLGVDLSTRDEGAGCRAELPRFVRTATQRISSGLPVCVGDLRPGLERLSCEVSTNRTRLLDLPARRCRTETPGRSLPTEVGFVPAGVRTTRAHAHPPREVPEHRDQEERRRASHGARRRFRRGDLERRQEAGTRARAAATAHEG
jgi:uncharacterized coiled-coil protein SlyX